MTVILVVLLIYFALRIILRLSMPYIMRYLSRKAGQKFENMFRQMHDAAEKRQPKEGKTSIHHMPNRSKKQEPVGEYIDFEEIE